jgi:signal peptidase II
MKKSLPWFILAAIVFVLDQLSKQMVLSHFRALELCAHNQARLAPCDQPIMPFFNLTMLWNPGVSMSLFTAESDVGRWGLTLLTLAISGFVVWALLRETDRWQQFAFALILGGAIGNIVDRVRFGAVADFIRFHLEPLGSDWSFYVFNVADAGISVGVAVLVIRAFFPAKPATETEKA